MRLSALRPDLQTMDGVPAAQFADAASVTFDCPGCVGTRHRHRIWAPFQGKSGSRVAWCAQGDSIENLTFVDSPQGLRSIRVLSGCKSHFNVTNGAIDFYGDSGHNNQRATTMADDPATEGEQTAAPAPADPLAGFRKTYHLRFKGGRLQQRWDSGHDGPDPQWVDVEDTGA